MKYLLNMIDIKCEICGKNFGSTESLSQHSAAKHSQGIQNKNQTKINNKKIKNLVIFVVISVGLVALIVWGISAAMSNSRECKTASAETINIGGHKNLALHIHSNLRITINNGAQLIPANIGILPNIMRPIHTHDASGELHIEGLCRRDFTLGEFFKIWGREFNSQCIFDNCIDNGELKMLVNGQENQEFENLILRDGQNILIEYKSNL